jgi:hypothetical protein
MICRTNGNLPDNMATINYRFKAWKEARQLNTYYLHYILFGKNITRPNLT